MNFEREKNNKTEKEEESGSDYELVRFNMGWKALAGLDVALLHSTFAKEEPTLHRFAEKCLDGYKAMGKTEEVIDELNFNLIQDAYQKRIINAKTQEEKETLATELEKIKRIRDEKLKEEQTINKAFGTIFDTFKNAFEK